jgi:hypothetical protein
MKTTKNTSITKSEARDLEYFRQKFGREPIDEQEFQNFQAELDTFDLRNGWFLFYHNTRSTVRKRGSTRGMDFMRTYNEYEGY